MLNSTPSVAPTAPDDDNLDRIIQAGPHGALTLAGIGTVIVVAIWFAFYFFVFVPRGVVQ